jgi:hypothetical protein
MIERTRAGISPSLSASFARLGTTAYREDRNLRVLFP